MKWYITVKMRYLGELYDVDGPYNTYEEAEYEFELLQLFYENILEDGQYLSIVPRQN